MKSKVFLRGLCFVTLATLGASVSYAALQDGLVSYWPLDSNFNDVRGPNDGVFVGSGAASFGSGKFGQGIDLNGTDQYVNVGNHSSLNMSLDGPAGNGNLSISAWFRVDAFDISWQAFISKGEGSNYRIARRDAGSVMAYAGGVGDIPDADLVGPNVNDGGLHNVVAISEAGVSARLYVDGTLVQTSTAPPVLTNDGNLDLFFGENPGSRGRYWDGLIDDVAIWNRPLTDMEIGSIWNGGTGASIGSLIPAAPGLGDVNGDGLINSTDFDAIRTNFLQSVTSRAQGDLNGDGIVDFGDFREWKAASGALSSSVSVPEPATLCLASALLVAFFRRRRLF